MTKLFHNKSQLSLSFDTVEFKSSSNILSFNKKVIDKKIEKSNKSKVAFEKVLQEAEKLTW